MSKSKAPSLKIVLISPHGSIIAYGLRTLSSCLLEAGHQVRMVFLPFPEEVEPIPGRQPVLRYSPQVLDEVANLCREAGLIGVTCSSLHFPRVALLTDFLKKRVTAPVIWGGIHPSIDPAACLKHADLVCVGEGEEAMVALANRLASGLDFHDVSNLACLGGEGQLCQNPLAPLIADLDTLPFPDYRLEDHFILHDGHLNPMTAPLAAWYLSDGYTFGNGSAYHIWATRGCPHRCAYCGNSIYQGLYPHWSRVRRMSPARIVAEIEWMRAQMPFVSEVAFMDDTFFSASEETIEEFAALYSRRIGLPFFACTSPATLTRRKLEALVPAGLRYVWMGIQSGSPSVQEIYQRNDRLERIVAAARLLHEFAGRIRPPVFDVIIDRLFQRTEDQRLTVRLLLELPGPFQLAVYSMTFFPGTEITRRALAEKRIDPAALDLEKSLVRLERSYFRLMLWLAGKGRARGLLRLLSRPRVFAWFSWPGFNPLWHLAGTILDHREGRQLVSWTLAHRERILARHFPDEPVQPLRAPFVAALTCPPIPRLGQKTDR